MPPKRKDSATTPVVSGPKPKRSKTSFRTPMAASLEGNPAGPSEVGLTANRMVTLRTSASGRRGYRSQDLSTTQSSTSSLASNSLATETSDLPSATMGEPIQHLDVESDTQPSSGAKPRPKQKNTTTVRLY